MEMLAGIEAFVVTFVVLAAVALVIALGTFATFVRVNRTTRLRQGAPLVAYYRSLLHVAPAH